MKFEDLKGLYLKKREQFGDEVYKHTSELLKEAKEVHKQDWLKHPTPGRDHEQSWRSFKGKNLEKLILFMIEVDVKNLGLKVINGNHLERTLPENLSYEESQIKRRLCVDFGEFGLHLPDVDLVIYNPDTFKILAVLSSKVTLRERIAQTGYWKLKLLQDKATRHIKVYFLTPDEDKTLKIRKPAKKGRAIVEVDLDGSYILTEEDIEESDKVKLFEHFIDDLKRVLKNEDE
jgi:type II restriction enzyme